jgi:hypothetical protein
MTVLKASHYLKLQVSVPRPRLLMLPVDTCHKVYGSVRLQSCNPNAHGSFCKRMNQ